MYRRVLQRLGMRLPFNYGIICSSERTFSQGKLVMMKSACHNNIVNIEQKPVLPVRGLFGPVIDKSAAAVTGCGCGCGPFGQKTGPNRTFKHCSSQLSF